MRAPTPTPAPAPADRRQRSHSITAAAVAAVMKMVAVATGAGTDTDTGAGRPPSTKLQDYFVAQALQHGHAMKRTALARFYLHVAGRLRYCITLLLDRLLKGLPAVLLLKGGSTERHVRRTKKVSQRILPMPPPSLSWKINTMGTSLRKWVVNDHLPHAANSK